MKTLQSFKKERVALKSVKGGTYGRPQAKISGDCIPDAPGGSDCAVIYGFDWSEGGYF